jgi:hydroxylamine reductase
MFCNQCEQAAKGTGCDTSGVCGKKPDIAALQDLLVYQLRGIGYFAHEARKRGAVDDSINRFTIEALFTTVTNVNFDAGRLKAMIDKGYDVRNKAEKLFRGVSASVDGTARPAEAAWPAAARFTPAGSVDELVKQAGEADIRLGGSGADIVSLKQLLLYGLKGMAAYADHAYLLGKQDDLIFAFVHEALSELNNPNPAVEQLVGLNMRCGTVNIRCMEILDEAHTTRFGHPEPTQVSTGRRTGPAIVVTGHDLLDLEAVLIQTEGKGVNIYTHGEMLPAHGYPGLKKYKHLAGHFGTAWQNQQKEFDGVRAAFLFTTNCIQRPKESYKNQVFTCGLVGWPGVAHVNNRDFSAVIKKAVELGGFEETAGGSLLTGCGHHAVLGLADTVVAAVKSGAIRRFFLVGGCDGAKPGRNYYTELAETIPKDCVILTLACGKFRFNNLDFGTIGGIPRMLDMGQCNDAHSALVIATTLAKVFSCGVNDLPLSIILSWYEQKAVVILLSLLSLGIKGIRIGPTLPAFISPNILKFLVEKFDVKPIGTAKGDLQAILGGGDGGQ